jgi:hypothetical protein
MTKRGMVSPVFKYIFAMIVGGMFIMFFIAFGMDYIGTAEDTESAKLVHAFDDTMDILASGSDASENYKFSRETTIRIVNGKIFSGSNTKGLSTSKIIFSPILMKGKSLRVWTKRWDMPFPVTNFFYVHNEMKYKYYFLFDTNSKDFVDELTDPNQEIPGSFKVFKNDISVVKPSSLKASFANIQRARFIIFSSSSEAQNLKNKLASIKNVDVLIVKKIDPNSEDWESGIIEFETGSKSTYLGRAMLLGAIFANSRSDYNLAIKRAYSQLEEMAELYDKKASYLGGALPSCSYGRTSPTLQNIDSILKNAEKASKGLKDTGDVSQQIVKDISSAAGKLEDTNEEFGAPCPNIF